MGVGFIRLLIIGLIIWLLLRLYRGWQQKQQQLPQERRSPRQIGTMVRCDYCGLHIPDTEAIISDKSHFCCEQHRKQHQQSP
ncbi:hypothetical protein D5085_11535 [Ectothiorhodospiraceae bacterium BW-2]|nr:hypothetical protein D5085_11535 [Ectothiorhodospiraceae bacterium BW-2]